MYKDSKKEVIYNLLGIEFQEVTLNFKINKYIYTKKQI